MRELELEVAEKKTDLEDQTRKTVDDLIKKKEQMAKMEKLRKAQLDRVVEEINFAGEDGEIVCVQHRKPGQIHRLFQLKDKMLTVCDWSGASVVNRCITQPFSTVPVSPDPPMEKFTRTILQTIEVNEPIAMLESESITFSGYHQNFKEIFEKMEN